MLVSNCSTVAVCALHQAEQATATATATATAVATFACEWDSKDDEMMMMVVRMVSIGMGFSSRRLWKSAFSHFN